MQSVNIPLVKFLIILGLFLLFQNSYSQNRSIIQAAAKPKDPPPGLTLEIYYDSGSVNFGTFYKETGGTIKIDPNTLERTIQDGDFQFLSYTDFSVASFRLYSEKNKNVIVTAPAIDIIGTGPNNSTDVLRLVPLFDKINYVSQDETNPVYIYLGGTLTVDSFDDPGPYSGTIQVDIAFE